MGWVFPGNLRKGSSIGSWEPGSDLRRREVGPWGSPRASPCCRDPQPGWPLGPMGNGSRQPGSPWPGYVLLGGSDLTPQGLSPPAHATRSRQPGDAGVYALGAPEATAGGLVSGGCRPGLLRGWLLPQPPGGGGHTQAQEVWASARLILITFNLLLKITQSQPKEDYRPEEPLSGGAGGWGGCRGAPALSRAHPHSQGRAEGCAHSGSHTPHVCSQPAHATRTSGPPWRVNAAPSTLGGRAVWPCTVVPGQPLLPCIPQPPLFGG